MKHGKKYNDSAKLIETGKFYDTEEAIRLTLLKRQALIL